MVNIHRVTKAIITHRDVRHVAIAYREDGLSLYPVGLNVHPTMEMVRSRFAKVTRQCDGIVYR